MAKIRILNRLVFDAGACFVCLLACALLRVASASSLLKTSSLAPGDSKAGAVAEGMLPYLKIGNISMCKPHHPKSYPIDDKVHPHMQGEKLYTLPFLSHGPANQMSQLKSALMLSKLLGR